MGIVAVIYFLALSSTGLGELLLMIVDYMLIYMVLDGHSCGCVTHLLVVVVVYFYRLCCF